jgi:DNA-binding XRE family transcriptional regulator
VGKQIGLKKGTMSDIETGRRMPSFKYLIALCKLFEVPCEEIEWIFADSDSETNTNDSTKRTKNKEK